MPLLVGFCYGSSAFVVPLVMASIYQVFGLRTSLDVLGGVFTIYAIGFTLHAAKNNWGHKEGQRQPGRNDDDE